MFQIAVEVLCVSFAAYLFLSWIFWIKKEKKQQGGK